MTRAAAWATPSMPHDMHSAGSPAAPGRSLTEWGVAEAAPGSGMGSDVIRIKLGHLAHADVGVPGRRCRWRADAGAWQACSASPVTRWAVRHRRPLPRAKTVGWGSLVVVVLLVGLVLGREPVAVGAGVGVGVGEKAGVVVGDGSAAAPARAPEPNVAQGAGAFPLVSHPQSPAGGLVARPTAAGPSLLPPAALSTLPALAATSLPAAPATSLSPSPSSSQPSSLPSSSGATSPLDAQRLPSLAPGGAVALPDGPGRLVALAGQGPVGATPSATAGGTAGVPTGAAPAAGPMPPRSPAPPVRAPAAQEAIAGATSGARAATAARAPDGEWREGTWDAARAESGGASASRAASGGAGRADASEAADVVMPRAAVAAPPSPAEPGAAAGVPSKRAQQTGAVSPRKAVRPRAHEANATLAVGPSKRRGASPVQDEPALVEPADTLRPASAWQRTGHRERLVAILDTDTVVVPDSRGVPARFRLGDRLPSGARVVRIDLSQGRAETDRGTLLLE